MAKSPINSRYGVWAFICLAAILMGIGFLASLFLKISIIAFTGIPLLVFGVSGIIIMRRKVSRFKRLHPELYEAPKVKKCAFCGEELTFPFQCYYCKRYFCEAHKPTKNHHCHATPKLSFRALLLISPAMFIVGTVMLCVSLLPAHIPPKGFLEALLYVNMFTYGIVLIAAGIGGPIARAWMKRQSRRAMEVLSDEK